MDDCQYATIDDVKKFSPALKHKILQGEAGGDKIAAATISAPSSTTTLQLECHQQEEQPPPLPPLPPPKNNQRLSQLVQKTHSPPLLRGTDPQQGNSPRTTPPMQKASSLEVGTEKPSGKQSAKAASEENVSTSTEGELRADSLMHTSVSSPTLSAVATPLENGSGSMSTTPPPSPDQTDGFGSKKKPPVYAIVNKPGSPPPPLPPPLAPEDLPQENPDLILAPHHGNETDTSKPRRPVPLPRTHVYETVPTDFAVQTQPPQPQGKPHGQSPTQSPVVEQYSSPSLFKSSLRRSSKKKKISKSEKEKYKGAGKVTVDDRPCPPPLTSLADLEPLPTDRRAMKLAEFVRLYGHYLPLRVKVEEGYCGTEERFVISSGDVYNFHFVKNEKIVSIRDCGGSSFSIPLNSAIQFSLLYNPGNNFKAALQGHVFKTVSELAASKHALPRIVCATRTHLASESKLSVLSDELLVVRKIGRTTVMRKPVLKALSLKTNEEKTLQEDCEGHFSTNPDLLKLYLPEVLEHFSQSLPLESMLYIKQDTSDDLPLHLTTDMVTVSHTAIESSIIASTCWEYEKQEVELSEEDRALVAIPTDLDIEVMFLGRESEDEKLYESTRDYFEKFSTLKIKDMKNSGGMQRGKGSTLTQTKLYKNVREGVEPKGTEIKMPYRLSGVFDGELSPGSRSIAEKYPALLENGEEGGVGAVSPTQSPKKGPNKEDRNSLISPHHTPNHVPNHTSNHTPHHVSNHTPVHPLTSAPGDVATPTTNMIPKTQDSDLEDLEKLYSDIDDIFEVTMQSADSAVLPPVDPRTSAKPTGEQKVANPAYIPSMRASLAEPLLQAPPPPKPMPRTRSQTEIAALAKQKQQVGGGEVIGQEGAGGSRTLTFEELSRNYEQLQLEMQQLKKELENARELEAGYEVVPSHTDPPSAAVRLRGAPPTTSNYTQRPLSIIKANSIQDQKKNKEYLRNLDHLEVICLLESMNLGQYRDNFMSEQVDGEILVECDENTLEKELHIASTLHRSRLMKVITGRHSALSFLQAGDVYSTLDHR